MILHPNINRLFYGNYSSKAMIDTIINIFEENYSKTLREYIEQTQHYISNREKFMIFIQIAHALNFLYKTGRSYGNLSSDNIFVFS